MGSSHYVYTLLIRCADRRKSYPNPIPEQGRGSNGGIDEDAWAEEFDHRVKKAIAEHDVESLSAPDRWGRSLLAEAHPTLEHYAPILCCLGSTDERDRVSYPYEGMEFGAISMRMALFEPVDT